MKIVLMTLLMSMFAVPTFADESQERQQQFVSGAKKWATNCTRCHNLRVATEFSDNQWRAITFHMRLRAGFTGQDTRDMLIFLQDSNN